MFAALGHDFVLRRNIRIGLSKSTSKKSSFISTTSGSHHIRLVNHNNQEFNRLLKKEPSTSTSTYQHPKPLPILPQVRSGEKFGLVPSAHTEAYGGLLSIKEEGDENELVDILDERFNDDGVVPEMSSESINSAAAAEAPEVLYVLVSYSFIIIPFETILHSFTFIKPG